MSEGIDAERRRLEEQRGLETLVVPTVNKAIRSGKLRKGTKDCRQYTTVARLKHKKKGGIKKSSRHMALNTITHVKPYFNRSSKELSCCTAAVKRVGKLRCEICGSRRRQAMWLKG